MGGQRINPLITAHKISESDQSIGRKSDKKLLWLEKTHSILSSRWNDGERTHAQFVRTFKPKGMIKSKKSIARALSRNGDNE